MVEDAECLCAFLLCGPQATEAEMKAAKLDMMSRDACAGLLIPLNKCRRATFYAPWKCEDLRHSYEKCEFDEFMKRVKEVEANPSLRDTKLA
eukprot:jgi/Chlat1/5482/Chrsp36S00421